MVKVLEEKGTRQANVGYRVVNLRRYNLEVNPTHLETTQDVKREVCKLCYLGKSKENGGYNSLEEKRKCDDCATDINRRHDQAKKEGKEFVVEVESLKVISPALTTFGKNFDQPTSTIKGLEEDF